jgi:predicted dehydrogenase
MAICLAQIGCGYWGPNLLRNFTSIVGCQVKYLADNSDERRKFVSSHFPNIRLISDASIAVADPDVSAVVIVTPAGSHFALAKQALEAGKHVFVEKPLATSVAEVDVLADIARARGLIVMSGHTFLYNDAVRYIKEQLVSGSLGDVRYLYSQRLNLGRIRSDIDALWNFAPHDISILQYLLGDPEPESVHSHGMDFIQDGIDDVVFLNIRYPKVMANIHVSWLDPLKVRKIVVVGSEKMIVYDDVAEDKIAIYDKGIDKYSHLGENMDFDEPARETFRYRSGDILIPRIDYTEPLRREAQHFLDCIQSGQEPLSGLTHSREVVRILEMAKPMEGIGQ